MAEREGEPRVTEAIRKLQAEAILTYSTDGMNDEDVSWVTPQDLRMAANKLRQAVEEKNPETEIILETYARHAYQDDEIEEDVPHQFIQDLQDIVAITEWAEWLKATKMTLFVGW